MTTKTVDTCYQSSLPFNATINYNPDAYNPNTGTNGVVYGNIGVCDYFAGKHVQTINYMVKTTNYAAKAAHTPIIGWFKAQHHGIGMYFGDTSSLPCQNGYPGSYNTRIEAWSIWHDNPTSDPEKNSSTSLNYNNTCGEPWVDDTYYFVHTTTDDSQWSQYNVYRYDLLYGYTYYWNLITPTVTQYVNFTQWVNQGVSSVNGVFDSSAKGTWIGSTPPSGNPPRPEHQVPWEIEFVYINRSWYD